MSDNRIFVVKNSSLGTSSKPYVVPSRSGRTGTVYGPRLVDVAGFPSTLTAAHNNVVQSGTWSADNMSFLISGGTVLAGQSVFVDFAIAMPSSSPSNSAVPLNLPYSSSQLNLPIRNALEGDSLTNGNYYVQAVSAWTKIASDSEGVNGIEMTHVSYGETPVLIKYNASFYAKLFRRVSVNKGDLFWVSNLPILPEIFGRWFFEIKVEYKIECTGTVTRITEVAPAWVVDPSVASSTPESWSFVYTMRKPVDYANWSPKGNYVFHSGSSGNAYVTTNTGNLVIS